MNQKAIVFSWLLFLAPLAVFAAEQTPIAAETINLDNPDEGCDLDFVPHEARQVSGMEYTLCNSFGFGGTNGSLIFKKV